MFRYDFYFHPITCLAPSRCNDLFVNERSLPGRGLIVRFGIREVGSLHCNDTQKIISCQEPSFSYTTFMVNIQYSWAVRFIRIMLAVSIWTFCLFL